MARILIGNIKGPQGERGPQGIQGPVGPAGPQGPLPPLVNNGLTTVAGKSALDAAYGKTLADKDTELDKKIAELNGNIDNLLALKTLSIPVIEGSNYVDLDFEIPDGYMLLTWKLLRDSNIVYHTQLMNNTKIRIWNTSSAQGSARGNITLIFAREQL